MFTFHLECDNELELRAFCTCTCILRYTLSLDVIYPFYSADLLIFLLKLTILLLLLVHILLLLDSVTNHCAHL